MFFVLGSSVKRRVMHELKTFFGQHPIYAKITPFIQQKYEFKERPQFGIVIKTASATPILLSSDHRIGTIISHVMLAHVEDRKNHSIEWVREDVQALQRNADVFPSPAGAYFVEVLTAPEDTIEGRVLGTFQVDRFLTVSDEHVLEFSSTGYPVGTERALVHTPTQGTVFASGNRKFPLTEDVEYEIDYVHGKFKLLREIDPNVDVFVDYRYFGGTTDPIKINWNMANNTAIPGVVMAFGRRIEAGDKQALIITDSRVETAEEYGGHTEIQLDFDVIARDQDQMEEISDLVFMNLWAQRRLAMADDGLVMTDFNLGGEVEESYDDTEETFYYNTTFSMTIRADWAIHVPMPMTFRHVTYMSSPARDQMALLNDEEAAKVRSSIRMDRNLGLTSSNKMYVRGRTWNYESIS